MGDLPASSKTGSGKTLAFVLPMIHSNKTKAFSCQRSLRCNFRFYRELAKQVYGELRACAWRPVPTKQHLFGGENLTTVKSSQRQFFLLLRPGRLAGYLEQSLTVFVWCWNANLLADCMPILGFAPELRRIANGEAAPSSSNVDVLCARLITRK
ncbi:DEAD/DEAH box helicase [Vibrio lentus]|nr:DEAD/DEAH box helicase [Vibrio lentus]